MGCQFGVPGGKSKKNIIKDGVVCKAKGEEVGAGGQVRSQGWQHILAHPIPISLWLFSVPLLVRGVTGAKAGG